MNAIRITLASLLAASLLIQVAAQAPAPAAAPEPTPVGKWHTIDDNDGKCVRGSRWTPSARSARAIARARRCSG